MADPADTAASGAGPTAPTTTASRAEDNFPALHIGIPDTSLRAEIEAPPPGVESSASSLQVAAATAVLTQQARSSVVFHSANTLGPASSFYPQHVC